MSCKFKIVENLFRETQPELADFLNEKGLQVWSLIKNSKLFKAKGGKYSLSPVTTAKRQKQIEFINSLEDFVYLDKEDVVVDLLKVLPQSDTVDSSNLTPSEVVYQYKEPLTEQQKKSIFELKQSNSRWNKYSDEDIQRFIDSVFPESQVKEMVYHRTSQKDYSSILETNFDNKRKGSGWAETGIFFSAGEADYYLEESETWGKTSRVIKAIVNLKNPFVNYEMQKMTVTQATNLKTKGFDGGQVADNEIMVFEPSQVYILNSDKAITDMEKFVGKEDINKQELINEVVYQLPQGLNWDKSNSIKIYSNINDVKLSISKETIYQNYKSLMNIKREGKELSYETFLKLLDKYQVLNYKNNFIFGQYDTKNAVFVGRLNSSPNSKELLAELIPKIATSGLDVINFVPTDIAEKYKRSGYTISNNGFEFNFKGEEMVKYAAASNSSIYLKLFNKTQEDVLPSELRDYNETLELKYTPVEIDSSLILNSEKETSKILETYLNQFGIVVKDIELLKESLEVDELGVADLLSKIAFVKDKKDLPPIAGEFISYMMQYNPLMQTIINELIQTDAILIPKNSYKINEQGTKIYNYKSLNKTQFFKYIGKLIAEDLQNKIEGKYNQSLIDKIKQLIKTFYDYLTKTEIDKINQNIGIISNNIIQQNKKLIVASLYKPGAFGKAIKQVNIEDALLKDKFGADIIYKLAKQGFILTGSTALSEQGTVLRPDENPLHDIDWVSPFNRPETENKFLQIYPKAIRVRDIYGDGYITDSFLIAPEGYQINNYVANNFNGKIIVDSYDVVDNQNNIVGTYRLQKQEGNNQFEEIISGVEGKIIDFFSYESYDNLNRDKPFSFKSKEGTVIQLANWKDIFKAKLNFARYKDIWDYNRFIPNENKPTPKVYSASGKESTLYPKIVDYIKENGFNPNEPYYKDYLEAGYIKDYTPEELAIVHYNLAYPNENIEPAQLFETLTKSEKLVLENFEIDPNTISTAEAKLIVYNPNEAIRQTMTYYKTMRGNNTENFYVQVRDKQDKLYKDYGCM